MKGLNDKNLASLWRQTILAIFSGKCFFCGTHYMSQEIECHHIKHRRFWLLKYDWRNGVPACKWVHPKNQHLKMSCHQYADTEAGRILTQQYQAKFGEHIQERSQIAKQYLVEKGLTREEFLWNISVEMSQVWAFAQIGLKTYQVGKRQ